MEPVLNFLYSLHFSPIVFALQLILFTAFHFAMKAVIYEPLLKARNEREGRIEGHLAKAEEAANNAKSLKQRYDEEILAERRELAQKLKEEISQAEAEAAKVMQQARDEANRVQDEAHAALDQEEQQLKAGMDDQAAKLAVAVAQQVVRNTLKEDAQEPVLQRLKG